MKFLLIYTTHKNLEEAQKITNYLLEHSIIACVNFHQITSQYKWKGSIETSHETVAILKTSTSNWEIVQKYIGENHPYETPCIIKLAEVEANKSYEQWIQEETKI